MNDNSEIYRPSHAKGLRGSESIGSYETRTERRKRERQEHKAKKIALKKGLTQQEMMYCEACDEFWLDPDYPNNEDCPTCLSDVDAIRTSASGFYYSWQRNHPKTLPPNAKFIVVESKANSVHNNCLELKPLTVDRYDNVFCGGEIIGRAFQHVNGESYGCFYEYPFNRGRAAVLYKYFPTQEECLQWIEKQHKDFLLSWFQEGTNNG